jgi:hypothetical protein
MKYFTVNHTAWCVTAQSLLSFPTFRVPFCRTNASWSSWPNCLPFYMLDPGFLATIFVVSGCLLTNDLPAGKSRLFMPESATLPVDSIYIGNMEAVK